MPEPAWIRALREAVGSMRYGSVEVQVHDGRVVQVETREKVRFSEDRPPVSRRRNHEPDGKAHREHGGAVDPTQESSR